MSELAPIDADLAPRNRRLMAERSGWPSGVLELCEQFDRDHPGWYAWWQHENTISGFEHAEGFVASYEHRGLSVCGPDVDALDLAVKTAPLDRSWSLNQSCCPRPRRPA